MIKIISYNVNGVRAAIRKGLLEWLNAASPDILCVQETKANPEQLDLKLFENLGYQTYWCSAVKKGYSGVAIITNIKPDYVEYGCGINKYDEEGRVIRADFGQLTVINTYMPSGSSGNQRQEFKMQWLSDFQGYINQMKQTRSQLVISGDYNLCHKPIDIHNPIANKYSPGFLPEERKWMDQFINGGFIDSFRFFNQEPDHYTWWSYMAKARIKNKGWRIDYNIVSESLRNKLVRASILSQAKHSDHCPVLLELDL